MYFKMPTFFRYLIFLFLIIRSSDEVTYSCNSTDVCGCSTKSVSVSRIVGGENTDTATWGWVVSISIAGTYICGGSIISSSWILTAAHCVNSFTGSQVTVYAGSTIRWAGTQIRQVSQVIVHPSFDPTSYVNDIALLQLASPLIMSDPSVSQICVPSVNSTILAAGEWPTPGTYATVIGWGRLTDGGRLPSTLQQVTVQMIDRTASTCSPLISNWQVQFCAGVNGGGKDACQGDSGGPIMMFTLSNQWVLVGIVSNGIGCAQAKYMGVYTRVAAFENWIRTNTNGSFSTARNLSASDIHPPNKTTSMAISNSVIYVVFFALFLFHAGDWIDGINPLLEVLNI